RLGEDEGAEVGEVVAIDGGDHGVLELHLADRLSDSGWLLDIVFRWPAVRDGAVRAVPRADVTQDHERGSAVLPALADVGAAGFLAHGVEVELAHQVLQPEVVRAPGRLHLEPAGFPLRQRLYAVATGYLVERFAH